MLTIFCFGNGYTSATDLDRYRLLVSAVHQQDASSAAMLAEMPFILPEQEAAATHLKSASLSPTG